MALIIDLKPDEKVIVGNSVITNDKQRTRLRIDGDAPILREKDTLTAENAVTPAKKLYFTIQTMYLDNASEALNKIDDFFYHLISIRDLAPHIGDFLNDISAQILQGQYYKGMKLVQDLINSEETGEEPKQKSKTNTNNDMINMEAQLLSQSADQLEELYNNWDNIPENERENTISYNRKLWMAFFDGVGGKTRENRTKADDSFNILGNIINLYNFIYKRSSEIINNGDKDKILSLIHINKECATALKR